MPDSALTPLKKAYYARILRRSDGKEEPELAVLADLVDPGDCVLDIGANIGIYTKRLSELSGHDGKVISMEPVPATFEILEANVLALKLDNVRCMNAAASDHTGLVNMEVPNYDTGWQNIYRARIVDNSGGAIQAISLDEAFRDLSRLDFIKCDVEGHELSVLRGATGIIQKHHPKWLIEVGGDPDAEGTESWQCFQLLAAFGYRAFIADGAGLCPRERGKIAVNYFFL
jgi:FkbM family methyltransferase